MLHRHGEKNSGEFQCSCYEKRNVKKKTWNNFPNFRNNVMRYCTNCDDALEKHIIKGQFNKRKPLRVSQSVVIKTPSLVGQVKRSLIATNPDTKEQQKYHYKTETETLVDGDKTYFYCCETGCNRNFSQKNTYKHQVINCLSIQANDEKKKKKKVAYISCRIQKCTLIFGSKQAASRHWSSFHKKGNQNMTYPVAIDHFKSVKLKATSKTTSKARYIHSTTTVLLHNILAILLKYKSHLVFLLLQLKR